MQRIPLFHDLTLNNVEYFRLDDDVDMMKYTFSHNCPKRNG